jgi:hypothetical protein
MNSILYAHDLDGAPRDPIFVALTAALRRARKSPTCVAPDGRFRTPARQAAELAEALAAAPCRVLVGVGTGAAAAWQAAQAQPTAVGILVLAWPDLDTPGWDVASAPLPRVRTVWIHRGEREHETVALQARFPALAVEGVVGGAAGIDALAARVAALAAELDVAPPRKRTRTPLLRPTVGRPPSVLQRIVRGFRWPLVVVVPPGEAFAGAAALAGWPQVLCSPDDEAEAVRVKRVELAVRLTSRCLLVGVGAAAKVALACARRDRRVGGLLLVAPDTHHLSGVTAPVSVLVGPDDGAEALEVASALARDSAAVTVTWVTGAAPGTDRQLREAVLALQPRCSGSR